MQEKRTAVDVAVSCRMSSYAIQQLNRMGLPVARVAAGTGYTLEELQDAAAFIPWNQYLVFFQNIYQGVSDAQFVALCTSYDVSLSLRPLMTAAGLWCDPARYFEWVAAPDGAIQQLFRCLETRCERVGKRELVLEERLCTGYAAPPDLFWESQAIAFGALTANFGLGPSIVTWEPIERGAAFRVLLPRRRPLRQLFAKVASRFCWGTPDDVRVALQFGHARSLRLEREADARKQAEQALRESEERFRVAAEASGAGVWDHWMDRDEIGFSDQLRAIYGLSPDARITLPVLTGLIHPDDRAGFERVAAAAADPDGGHSYNLDHRIIRPDGEVRWVRSFGRSLFDSNRRPVRSIGIARDVTAQKQTEAALRESEGRYRTMFEANPHPMWVYDLQTFGFLAVNDAAVANYGYTREEFLGMTIKDIRPPEDVPALVENVASVTHGYQHSGVWRHRLKDGRTILVRIDSHTMAFAGRPAELVLAHNVTDQLRAEEQLRESEMKLRTILDSEPECVKLLDRRGRLLEMNPAGLRMVEAESLDDVRGAAVRGLVAGAEQSAFDEMVTAVFRGESRRLTFGMTGLAGTPRVLETHSVPLWSADRSEVRALLGVTRDVTDRVRAEEALRESEAQFRTLIEYAPEAVVVLDADTGRFELVNRNAETLFGLSREALCRVGPAELSPPVQPDGSESAPAARMRVDEALAGGAPVFDWVHRTALGVDVPCEVRLARLPASGRRLIRGSITDISARHRAEERLRASEARLSSFFTASPVGMAMFDADGRWSHMNPTLAAINGLPAEAHIGRRPSEVLSPELAAGIESSVRRTLETGVPEINQELSGSTPAAPGVTRYWLSTQAPIFDHADRTIGVGVIVVETTALKRADAALRESEERYRTLIANIPGSVYRSEILPPYRDLFLSEGIRNVSGYDAAEYFEPGGPTCGSLILADDLPGVEATVNAAVEKRRPYQLRYRIRHRDGSIRWVSENGQASFSSDGAPLYLEGIHLDVTAQVLAEQALRESEERLRAYIETAPTGVFVADETGRYVDVNPAACRLLGYGRDELLLLAIPDIAPAEALPESMAAFDRLKTAGSVELETTLRRKSGDVIWVSIAAVRLSGNRWMGFVTDTTDRRRAEQALRENEEQLRLAVETTQLGIWRHVIQSGRITLNERARVIFDLDATDISSEELTARFHPDDLARVRQEIGNASRPDADGSYATEHRILTRGGNERWLGVRANIRFIETPAGRMPSTVIGTMMDITERKRAEEALRATLGEKEAMLKEIHHRVKNNLQVISSLLNLQAERIADPAARAVFLESQSRVRAMALVHETLYGSESLARIELPQYLDRLCDSLLQTFGGNERVTVERDVAPVDLDLDRALPVGLIVSELVSNALKYAFPGGRRGRVRVSLATAGEAHLELSVADDGVGFPPDLDPDRTTSLGLYLVRALTRQLRGTHAIGRAGVGATFTLRFPK